ncbi:MAG: D-alanyl-D-alanine carboxypeptidase [Rickettsiales bacterium]|nr:D-alanyl-D-alanine carboxypeptidase [Rickettsiales bacterium]
MSKHTIFFIFLLSAAIMLPFFSPSHAFETKAKQMVLIDLTTKDMLANKDADTQMHPSSMSKLMTLYVLFDHIKQGKIAMDSKFKVSEKAWRKGGSKMFVRVDTEVTVSDLIRGIIVQSGNDACIVVAEGIAGTEEHFAKLMNDTAKRIGLTKSHFVNATGWPDANHLMSAKDLGILTEHLLTDFPDFYPMFAETEFEYNNIKQPNRNGLLHDNIGVDGLKTGHTDAGGYGIVVSAKSEDASRRLIAVVNGLSSEKERLEAAKAALLHGFNNFHIITALQEQQKLAEIPTYYGSMPMVAAGASHALRMTMPTDHKSAISAQLEYASPLEAPISKGDEIGTIRVTHPNGSERSIPLIALDDVAEMGFFGRAIHNFMQWALPAS